MSETSVDHIKGTIEAILFVSDKPVTLDQFKEVLPEISAAEVKQTIESLKKEFENRKGGMVIVEIANGYQMLSSSSFSLAIREFYKTRHKERLSKPALETLAIVAYKQPVARVDVELIRGVNSDGVVSHLLNKSLIKIVGRKDVPGRPFLYGTTKQFLEYFGLKSLTDLPKLEDFSLLIPVENQVLKSADTNEALPLSEASVASAQVSSVVADEQMLNQDNSTLIKKEVSDFVKEVQGMNGENQDANLVEEIIHAKDLDPITDENHPQSAEGQEVSEFISTEVKS